MPRQGLLEGLGEVEEAPADDDIVVEGHEEAHLRARESRAGLTHEVASNSLGIDLFSIKYKINNT